MTAREKAGTKHKHDMKRAVYLGVGMWRWFCDCGYCTDSSQGPDEKILELQSRLDEIGERTKDRPAIYKMVLPSGELIWFMTPFTYEQVEGNRQRILTLAKGEK